MTFFDRVRGLARKKNATSESMTLNQLLEVLGVHDVSDGAALSEATYYACIKVLSEGIGKLPLRIMRATPTTGIAPERQHPYYRALNVRPNPYMSASVFWTYMEACRNHYGNAYALIDQKIDKRTNAVTLNLWPLNPESMRVYYDDARKLADQPNVYYVYSTASGQVTYGSEEVLHFKSHHTIDGLVGVPVCEQLRSTITGNIKAQQTVNDMYARGMTANAALQYTGALSDSNVQTLVAQVADYLHGRKKAKGLEGVVPLPVGFALQPLNLKLSDSQFLEIKQYTALQIAAAFGVKPYQVGDYTKSSYASAEAQQLSFLVDTLLYNIKQYEEELSWKLLSDEDAAKGMVAKFNTAALLRTDQQTQISTLSTAVNSFLMTPNEARERLDLPHVEGGDKLLGNGASIPVEFAGQQYTTSQAAPAAGGDNKTDGEEESKE